MIIMPGETKTISLPMKRQANGSFSGEWKVGSFQEVAPPEAAPVQDRAKELGLPDGLRVEAQRRHGQWRCSNCNGMQPSGDKIWVPDSVRVGDPAWSVTEACRQNAYNGYHSAWCVPCARRLGGSLCSSITKSFMAEKSAMQFNYFPFVFGMAMLIGGFFVILMALTK